MRRRAILFGAGVLAAASLALAPPAAAQTLCAGTQNTAYVCTDPLGGTIITDCVYLGPPPCTPVTVPGPTLSCGGALIDPWIACRGF
ncbi:MAG TPA: hypothetical protein VHI71_02845 [Actinomycetota bacterium]|nr:hypothetical protein [Actinomycetota bacterium]